MENKKPSVLVLDAEPIVRTVVFEILSRAGYTVLATGELPEAERFAKSRSPALLLTDVVVPGSTGRNAAKTLTSICPNMRVLMISGLPDENDGIDFFPKPFTAGALVNKVEEILNTTASRIE